MPYRNDTTRRVTQQGEIFGLFGHVFTWRQFVGSAAGAPVAGMPGKPRYREQQVTGLFTRMTQPETQAAGGQFASADFQVTTAQRLGRNDELVWQGVVYRVESDAVPAPISGTWVTEVKRGK